MGRLRLDPAVWGEMTLAEFYDAVQGFNDLEEERLRWQFFTTRKICYFIAASQGNKDIKEEDIIPIKELDDQIEKIRVQNLPTVSVQTDGGTGTE